ncbi:MAG: signal peptidase II [Bacillota bacterium]
MVYLIAIIVILFDQWFKILIEQSFKYGQTIPVIENVFYLTYIRNTGAAFGIFQEHIYILIILSVCILALFLYFIVVNNFDSLLFKTASGLIIGGAVGNLIDRIRLGYVIDYLDFKIWPVFNLADMAVVIGGGLLIIVLWKS